MGPRSTTIEHQVAPTPYKQKAKRELAQYLQVPVDNVMLVDVVNTLQNLMYTVAAKAARKEMSVQG